MFEYLGGFDECLFCAKPMFFGFVFFFYFFVSLFLGFSQRVFCGGFDSGSGRTLAACLTHASRTGSAKACFGGESGERVSNA